MSLFKSRAVTLAAFSVRLVLPLLWSCLDATPAMAQTAENVAVVINDNSPASQRIGDYYVRARAIPSANIIHIRTSTDETIARALYTVTIEAPIAGALARERLQDRVLYVVLTKGIPLRIAGSVGVTGDVSSVDSELTLLYRRMAGLTLPVPGRIDNPYFLGSREIGEAKRFTHRDFDIFLVSRLDAFTVEEAIALVDRAKEARPEGKFVLDERAPLVNRTGDDWLELASKRLTAQQLGDRVVLEASPQVVRDVQSVLGYYSWGSNDPRNRVRSFGMGFLPGSLAATFVSTDGRTFKQPPPNWVPSDSEDKSKTFEGSPQSLIGDLIHDGATGVAGHVAEPFLQSTIRPDILFPAYVSGANLIEAFYLAMPYLSWQTVVVGDPLCAPFPRKNVSRSDIEDPVDESLRLPGLFAARRLATATKQFLGIPEPALRLALRGESSLASGDVADARASFEEATRIAPRVVPFEMQLGMLYDRVGEKDRAIERYQRVIEMQPRNALALNNLAYSLAVNRKSPAEALPLAQQAVAAAPNEGTILDTLAWVQHLVGDNATAAKTIFEASRRVPGNPEIRLHAAIINAANGARAVAEDELKAALQLQPAWETRDDVRALREAIEKLGAAK